MCTVYLKFSLSCCCCCCCFSSSSSSFFSITTYYSCSKPFLLLWFLSLSLCSSFRIDTCACVSVCVFLYITKQNTFKRNGNKLCGYHVFFFSTSVNMWMSMATIKEKQTLYSKIEYFFFFVLAMIMNDICHLEYTHNESISLCLLFSV